MNTNYADLSFFFTILAGEKYNAHLEAEYLAVLETDNSTPYFLNLHNGEVPHTLILGMTGSGKSYLCCFLLQNAQKYRPLTFIFDIGASFQSLTSIFSGSYLNVGQESRDFAINPFSLPPGKDNLQFLFSFFRVLIEGDDERYRMNFKEERKLWHAIEQMYVLKPEQRTVSNFGSIIGELKERLRRWTRGGQYGFLFDNVADTLSFSRFQTFNFHGWDDAPEVLEPLLFYVLHRATAKIVDPDKLATFKVFLLDEAWLFIKNATIRNYVVQAQKTWRKHNGAMILATQSLKEFEDSGLLPVVSESFPPNLPGQPGNGPQCIPRGVPPQRYRIGSDCRTHSAGTDACSQGTNLEKVAVKRRFQLALDGDQQSSRQSQNTRLFQAFRYRGWFTPSRSRSPVPAAKGSRRSLELHPQPLRRPSLCTV